MLLAQLPWKHRSAAMPEATAAQQHRPWRARSDSLRRVKRRYGRDNLLECELPGVRRELRQRWLLVESRGGGASLAAPP